MEGDFRVAGWLVQPHLNVIVSPDGRTLHLEPRVMEVLEFLAARPGEVLSKDAIIHSVWRDSSGSVYAADVRYTPNPAFGAPRKLFEGSWRFPTDTLTRSYDLSPDGKGFVMTEAETRQAPATEIRIVANRLAEIRRLVPSR